jgi:hypothetical protein
MLHVVILTKRCESGKIICVRSTIAKLRRDNERRNRVFTSSGESFNHVPSTDGSGSDPFGKAK